MEGVIVWQCDKCGRQLRQRTCDMPPLFCWCGTALYHILEGGNMATGLYTQSILASLRVWEKKLDNVEQSYSRLVDKSTVYGQEMLALIGVYRQVVSVLQNGKSIDNVNPKAEKDEYAILQDRTFAISEGLPG